MPDPRRHRGPNPQDAELFAPERLPVLRSAVADLSRLLSRGYPSGAALKLVGDRHALRERQRLAVRRAACSDAARADRARRRVCAEDLAGRPVDVDGFNVLTTVEAALAGGVVLGCRDGCYRDMASMHGSWRKVEETLPAVTAVMDRLRAAGAGRVRWLLDAPVSNSGRLRAALLAAEPSVEALLVPDPDRLLARSDALVASADSGVLDACGPWLDLARRVVEHATPEARLVDLGATS